MYKFAMASTNILGDARVNNFTFLFGEDKDAAVEPK